ncbi:hypothetical protein L226DRAFT_321628 [Lentinus tigrinus ALCF2SS1-7]|uniref:uncharacterized protein n=1 Tax=Lentinus tigrinus ALCF2SS1-7 TaxID=1328758 RepID=UPI0011660D48|nr:hypothetical protein L226DRAFT_321628 [Lentinus tigrinus ALCF2SS1-7]
MWRAPPSLVSQTMPVELIHKILVEAWSTMQGSGEWEKRSDLFRKVSLISKKWANVMTDVALHTIVIGTERDFEFYQRIILREFGVDPDSKDHERVHPSAHEYFKSSNLYITLTEWTTMGTEFSFKCDYARIPHYIPSALYIEVSVNELPTNDVISHPFLPLFLCLSQYTNVSDLRLRWTYTHINRYTVPPQCSVRGVTYLRLVEFPRCNCQNFRHLVPGTGVDGFQPLYFPPGSHRLDCFSYRLPTLFPDLRHLHLETPYILKNLKILPGLTLLTLEAPPVHYLPSLGYFSSLMSWNVVSAVKSGLMRRTDGDALRKKIVVNGGLKKPLGWRKALAACQARGVELELRHVYKSPDVVPTLGATKSKV